MSGPPPPKQTSETLAVAFLHDEHGLCMAKPCALSQRCLDAAPESHINQCPLSYITFSYVPMVCRGADASDVDVDITALDPELRGFSSDEEAPGRPKPLTHLPVVIPQQDDLRQAAAAAEAAAAEAAAAEAAAQDAKEAPTPR